MKHSIAVAIPAPGRPANARFLAVRRPPDDEELPGTWGLPAATLREDETPAEAVERIGRDKLGVHLSAARELREGTLERDDCLVHMVLYSARIGRGEVAVPQPVAGVTQYVEWSWAHPRDLIPGARRGSLCCRLYLHMQGIGWTG